MPAGDGQEIVAELELSGAALRDALRRRDPCYLEHLERRKLALLQLSSLARLATDPTAARKILRQLEQLRDSCAQLEAEAWEFREEARGQLRDLDPRRRLAQAIRPSGANHQLTLDVKA